MAKEEQPKAGGYRLDIVVIAAILLIALSLLLILSLTKKEGSIAIVEIDGKIVAEYPLYQDGIFPLNGGTNVLVIEGGAAYLNYSSCPDHTCENIGKIHYVGETIVCLPNKVTITINGNADDGVDLVS
jgi:hypothetical protein